MTSPPIDRTLGSLHPMFRNALEAWLTEARARVEHVDFRVTETRRTLERQAWLYAQSREAPYLRSPPVTWTLDSRHRFGLAADLAMIRKDTKRAIWEVSSWRWLYRTIPVEPYGLRHLDPIELVHLEWRYADEAIAEAPVVDLVQT
ncbi:MAG: M15 family metallopeptidase [Trueperaceae bacterium]|nr:M15 family metallopeptidase [Trueperaceae bacterium]